MEQFLIQRDRANGTHKKTVFSPLCLVMGTNGKKILCAKVLLSSSSSSFLFSLSLIILSGLRILSVSRSEYVIFIFVWN